VKGTHLEEVEALEQNEEEEVQEEEGEGEAVMKENQVMKVLHKDVIFARIIVMLKKITSSNESYNVFIAKSLVTCKKIVYY
jgi:hypothetical protein